MFADADLGALAEIARAARSLHEYESGALGVVGERVGFDVAMFKRVRECGAYTPGLDPDVARACIPFWPIFAEEIRPVLDVALRQAGVAVDVEVLGMRRLERLEYYQRLMRLHRGTSTAVVCLERGGMIAGHLCLGRTTGGFAESELAYLRALAPTLSVCDAAVLSPPPSPVRRRDQTLVLSLTRREREVLDYLRLGYTNSQIATALGTAERTVRNQLTSIYQKLDVSTRAEAAVFAVEHGVSAAPP